jgi:hypothetical protein
MTNIVLVVRLRFRVTLERRCQGAISAGWMRLAEGALTL